MAARRAVAENVIFCPTAACTNSPSHGPLTRESLKGSRRAVAALEVWYGDAFAPLARHPLRPRS